MKCSKPLQNHDQGLFAHGRDLSEKRENEICYETIHFGANIFRAFNGQLISAQNLPSTAPPPPRAPPPPPRYKLACPLNKACLDTTKFEALTEQAQRKAIFSEFTSSDPLS